MKGEKYFMLNFFDKKKLIAGQEIRSNKIIALAGNPNVGKSTVFNALTGMHQHTGNWPGKTVANAQGNYTYRDKNFEIVDIPGTYSLLASSVEEEIARDFICFGKADVTAIVVDATCLERNLNLVLQILEVTDKVVVCVNLLDEAKKKKIKVNLNKLSLELGVPVIGMCARSKTGLNELKDEIYDISYGKIRLNKMRLKYSNHIETAISLMSNIVSKVTDKSELARWISIKLLDIDEKLSRSLENYLGFDILKNEEIISVLDTAKDYLKNSGLDKNEIRDAIVSDIAKKANEIYNGCVVVENKEYNERDRKLDKILTSKSTGIPIMLFLLGIILWITIIGANYPSKILYNCFFIIGDKLEVLLISANLPQWFIGMIVHGMYRTLAWVVSVMLPPMAIFFPLFTLLEDFGYLPRIAFNLDSLFKKASAHGKQALTTCMGFGCNTCGVIGTRIIDSPRERFIAILTNNFVPCNGRFPTLITIISIFLVGNIAPAFRGVASALILLGVILLGIIMILIVSKILSKTVLKGLPSSFILELPPYRKPQIVKVIVRSIFDRTFLVLGRAIVIAIPAGLIIWLMSNITFNDISLIRYCSDFLEPFAKLIGLDGVILMAFILGFPANEIVIPIIIMTYMETGMLVEIEDLAMLKILLVDNGWTLTTAICTMIFSLFHFPCGTTCLTIKKETGSWKWMMLAIIIPSAVGIVCCLLVNIIGFMINLI